MNNIIGIIEAAAELAEVKVNQTLRNQCFNLPENHIEDLIYEKENGKKVGFTDTAQIKFEEYYEEYYGILLEVSMKSEIKFKLDSGVEMPEFKSEDAVGFDIRVNSILKVFKGSKEVGAERLESMRESFKECGYIMMREFERILFGSGIYIELSSDLELQIRSRSGMVLNRGITVANQPGTVDPDYRGEVAVMLLNNSNSLAKVGFNERVAQGVPKSIIRPVMNQVKVLSETARGEGGFGSTGTNK